MNSSSVGGFSSQLDSLERQHPDLVAGPAHQRRLDLIVAEDIAAKRTPPRQRRQAAMCDERRETQNGVVPPVRPAIALPPGGAQRVGTHAEPHAELEQARESADRRQSDDQSLKDAERRVRLHDAQEPERRLGGHEAVGVEDDREFVADAPSIAEVADIAGFVSRIQRPPPVGHGNRPPPSCGEGAEPGFLGGDDVGIVGVAENIDVKQSSGPCGGQAVQQGLEIPGHRVRALVADAREDGGRRGQRLIPPDARGHRIHRGDRIATTAHDQKADACVPESDDRPRQRHGEKRKEDDSAGAARRNRQGGKPQDPGHCDDGQCGE